MTCVPIRASGHCYNCPKWHFRLHAVRAAKKTTYYCEACCPVCHPPAGPIDTEPVKTIEGQQANLFEEPTRIPQ